MINSRLKIYKIKSESVETLREWGSKLMGKLLSDAVDSLREENCIFEEARIFYLNNQFYVFAVMLAEPDKNFVKGPDSEINLKHREKVQNSIIEEVKSELLYIVDNFKNL